MTQKRLEDLIKVLESMDKFVSDDKIAKNHFLYNQLIAETHTTSNITRSNSGILPNNLNVLAALQNKYRHALTAYKKQFEPPKHFFPPKYSLKRFVGKIVKKIRGNDNV